MAPPSRPPAPCDAGGRTSDPRPLRAKAQRGDSRARQAFGFLFFKSRVMERHSSWISAFTWEVTSLTKPASSEPAGLELDLEPVLCFLPVLPLLFLFLRPCLSPPPPPAPTHWGSPALGLPCLRPLLETRPLSLLPLSLPFPSSGREACCLRRGPAPSRLRCEL